jgi:hypothetical protein
MMEIVELDQVPTGDGHDSILFGGEYFWHGKVMTAVVSQAEMTQEALNGVPGSYWTYRMYEASIMYPALTVGL